MSSSFFIGDPPDRGTVSAVPVTTFPDFVRQILFRPTRLAYSNREYLELKKEKRDALKFVRFFSPFTFTAARRVYENAGPANLVAVDADDPADSALLLDTFRTQQLLDPWPFALYTTANHTPAAPRCRLVVFADAIPVQQYAQAVNTVGERLGIRPTLESYTVPGLMYLPVEFLDLEPTLFSATLDGPPLSVADIQKAPTTPLLKTAAPQSTPSPDEVAGGADGLNFLQPIIEGLTAPVVQSALGRLDPDCTYPEWIRVAAALRHQYGQDEAGFSLFNTWSAQGTKYTNPDETRDKYYSFAANPTDRNPITIRSLFFTAAKNGWHPWRDWLAWLTESGAATPKVGWAELITHTLGWFRAFQQEWRTHRVSAIDLLMEAVKKAGVAMSKKAITNELSPLDGPGTVTPLVAGILDPDDFVFVKAEERFIVLPTAEDLTPKALDMAYGRFFVPEGGDKPLAIPTSYLLHRKKIPCVYQRRYSPDMCGEKIFQHEGRYYLNTYHPASCTPTPATAAVAGDLFRQHVLYLFSDTRKQTTLLDFLAYIVQHPGKKIRWALLIQSCQGAGKSLIGTAMRALLGPHNVNEVRADLLNGGSAFNDWMVGHQLCIFEEMWVANFRDRDRIMNSLKDFITEPVISVHRKFMDVYSAPNPCNQLMFTNHKDAVVPGEGDRRYAILFSSLQLPEQAEAIRLTGHYARFAEMLHSNVGGLLAWFQQYPISSTFKPDGAAPRTEDFNELINASDSQLMIHVKELILDGEQPLVQKDLVSVTRLADLLKFIIKKDVSTQLVAALLRELHYRNTGVRMRLNDGHRHTLWLSLRENWTTDEVVNQAKLRTLV